VETCVARICTSLREPVHIGDATFHLTPYAGVAVLGQDAVAPKSLLDHARSAAMEARRDGTERICFFTDTVKLRSLARLDIARELRDAIANREVRLRYVPRHELEGGRLVAWVAYLQWIHPLRGEVRPAEFLSVAETTGLAAELSRTVLRTFRDDCAALSADCDPEVRFSFGPLRHHVLQPGFPDEIQEFIADAPIPADRFELRIAERAYVVRDPAIWGALSSRGVRLVVDEVGRKMSSLVLLARAPLWGLQLDRSWVTALQRDPVARKVCGAGIRVAAALDLTPIATGVDDAARRDALLALGCVQGLGDLYGPAQGRIMDGQPRCGHQP
jgi:EAL domain-containing protein (putative c-di-GMP-specific phosphodiesterase class I)